MFRRTMYALEIVVAALLVLAAPVFAGGWAVITLDTLPQSVHAGQAFQVGFMVRQHGRTPVNIDLNGKPLKPMVIAQKHGDSKTLEFAARQQGDTGHYVADVSLPSEGAWDWSITAPTYYVETNGQGNGAAATFEPLTVLPAVAVAPAAPAETAALPAQPAPDILGISPAVLRWAGALLVVVAAGIALASRRGRVRPDSAVQAQ